MIKLIVSLLPLILAGCGNTTAPYSSPVFVQSQADKKEAMRAISHREFLNAKNSFIRVLAIQRSVDDYAGAATTLIDLATVSHQLHDDKAALVLLDRVLLDKPQIYPLESCMIASFRKAVILTDIARLNEADFNLQYAENICEDKCKLKFGIKTLRARYLLQKGDAISAKVLASTMLEAGVEENEEYANVLRVIAASEEELAQDSSALQHYQNALKFDKLSGFSSRISQDLFGMARVSKRLGRSQDAAVFARRAVLVNESQQSQQ